VAAQQRPLTSMYCGAESCYDVLGLEQDVPQADIRKTYLKLSRTLHPDKVRPRSLTFLLPPFASLAAQCR
jgi:preprotein translocase subunit Sec63